MAGSMRQRGERSWELRVHAGRDPDTGRKLYVTKTVRGTKREAERELARLVAQVDDGVVTAMGRTVGEICERWFNFALPDLSPTVGPQYRSLLDRHILRKWGKLPAKRLRPADLDVWYGALRMNGGVNGKPLSANSVLRVHSVLHRALNQAVKWGWLAGNPASKASTAPPSPHDAHPTLAARCDASDRRSVEGERPASGVLPPGRRDRSTARRDLRPPVARHRSRHGPARDQSVGGQRQGRGDREGHQDPRRPASRPGCRNGRRSGRVTGPSSHLAEFASTEVPASSFVFSHEVDGHTPWRPDYATLAFVRLRDELGLGEVRLHDLRHFVATAMLAGGADIKTVSCRLGHADASTTLNIYAHFLEAPDRAAADRLGSILDQNAS